MKNATVQLNGKTYDAITGTLIADAKPSSARPDVKPATAVHRKPAPAPVRVAVAPAPVKKATEAKPAASSDTKQAVAIHVRPHSHEIATHTHRAPQPSKTLMRRAVKKPGEGLKKTLHVQTPLVKQADQVLVRKVSVDGVDQGRLYRAKHIEKHAQVKRYAHSPSDPKFQLAHVPVRLAPEDPKPQEEVAAPAPKPSNDPEDIFARAVENATHYVDVHARHHAYKKKARLHFASMTAGALAILLLAGFAAYQSLPGVQLSIAGVQAGVATAAPDLTASGFAYEGVSAHDGKRIIGFSNSQGQYKLIQQSTNWSDEDMIKQVSSVSASGDPNYSTIQAGQDTVYRLSNTQATWVKNGVWYQVTGNAVLSDSQLSSLVQNS